MAKFSSSRTKLRKAGVKRRCIERGCGKSIEERGHRAVRCEACAQKHLVRWRKRYDALPQNVDKRREYDQRPKNIKKAKVRRNKKIYLLGLCMRVMKMEGHTIDKAIDLTEKKLRSAGRKPPISKKDLRGVALPVSEHPWSTMRGKGPRKKYGKRIKK